MCVIADFKSVNGIVWRIGFHCFKKKGYLSKEAIGTQETYLQIVGDAGVKAVKTHCKICKIKAPGCRCPPCRNKNTRLEIAHTALQQNQWWPTSCQQRWPLFRAISFVRCIARCNYIYISIYIYLYTYSVVYINNMSVYILYRCTYVCVFSTNVLPGFFTKIRWTTAELCPAKKIILWIVCHLPELTFVWSKVRWIEPIWTSCSALGLGYIESILIMEQKHRLNSTYKGSRYKQTIII